MLNRQIINLNRGWEFQQQRMPFQWLKDEDIQSNTTLPHCWNAHDTFKEGVAYYQGWGSYRTHFQCPANGGKNATRWRLVAEGFYGTGDVWLNGHCLGKVDGQYLGFEFDVTDHLEFSNVLGVRLTNRCSASVLPGNPMPDFVLYGGLAGRVRLVEVPEWFIDDKATAIRSTVDHAGDAQIDIIWQLNRPASAGKESELHWEIHDDSGASLACEKVKVVHDRGLTRLFLKQPALWSPEAPVLYQVEGTLMKAGVLVDRYRSTIGVRMAEFRERTGFFLNGERVELRGCNRHESMPGFGSALPLGQHRADAELIKSMGLNFVRLSHYPQHPEFLNACDELGIMVYAEVASWKSVRGGRWLANAKRQMEGMIRRDRNHPSVILWGMGNEGRHRQAYLQLLALCKALDPTRAVTYAENHLYRARRKQTLGIPDVWGLNYEFDALKEAVEASRQKVVVVSECANYPHTQRGEPTEEAKQQEMICHDLELMAKDASIAGYSLWCFNDYATLRKQRYRRFSGIVDAWRIPKKSAYMLSKRYHGSLVKELTELTESAVTDFMVHQTSHWKEAGGIRVLIIEVEAIDKEKRRAAFNGEIRVANSKGRLCTMDADGSVWLADGIGRFFIWLDSPISDQVDIRIMYGNHLDVTHRLELCDEKD